MKGKELAGSAMLHVGLVVVLLVLDPWYRKAYSPAQSLFW